MRVLVISDIHANLAAFKAVLDDSKGLWEKIWFLGDLIGYGPDPNECTSLLREFDHIALSGNHDWAVLDKLDTSSFNAEAKSAITWTRDTITPETRAYLDSLPSKLVLGQFTLAHASPRQPVWEYILDPYTAAINFEFFDTPYCLVGHTHVPIWFEETAVHSVIPYVPNYGKPTNLPENRVIINPGSIGQPRDSDHRAAYALLDTDNLVWEYRRIAYDVSKTQEKMRAQNMPSRLVNRLEYGW
ncbi:MAG: metallophosphoesterase family protein [Ardenticatenaceae bacterium]|nr:metallophosphoesterase family protein [Ardenticatenaceae bacterium]MCB8989737.1 metallophosphoesterase family protein [Ardenticatenaceae bacterium]MCB9002804.1 metallophosphoesterase family protein [Ardenticatenaceae bacterium]